MFSRLHSIKFWLGLIATILLVAGCATQRISPPPKFAVGQKFEFSGMAFEVSSAKNTKSFSNRHGKKTTTSGNFVIVAMSMRNNNGVPLQLSLQPLFRLTDAKGAVYEPDHMKTLMINLNKDGRLSSGQTMNPNITVVKEIVFEAPSQDYTLQGIVPDRAHVGFAGSITSVGPYFEVPITASNTTEAVDEDKPIQGWIDLKKLDDLQPGRTTIEEVKKILGEPISVSKIHNFTLVQWNLAGATLVDAKHAHIAIKFDLQGKMIETTVKSIVR